MLIPLVCDKRMPELDSRLPTPDSRMVPSLLLATAMGEKSRLYSSSEESSSPAPNPPSLPSALLMMPEMLGAELPPSRDTDEPKPPLPAEERRELVGIVPARDIICCTAAEAARPLAEAASPLACRLWDEVRRLGLLRLGGDRGLFAEPLGLGAGTAERSTFSSSGGADLRLQVVVGGQGMVELDGTEHY